MQMSKLLSVLDTKPRDSMLYRLCELFPKLWDVKIDIIYLFLPPC